VGDSEVRRRLGGGIREGEGGGGVGGLRLFPRPESTEIENGGEFEKNDDM